MGTDLLVRLRERYPNDPDVIALVEAHELAQAFGDGCDAIMEGLIEGADRIETAHALFSFVADNLWTKGGLGLPKDSA